MMVGGRGRRHLLFAFGAVEGVMAVGLAITVLATGQALPSTIAIGLGTCFVPYALVLSLAGELRREQAEFAALVGLLLVGFVFVVTPPVLSDDVYRFVWEGRLWLEGYNPYQLAPADPSLERFRGEAWAAINNKSLATVYPPISQALFVLVAWIGGGIWTVKLLALGVHVATTVVVSRLSLDPRASLALALNPLLLSEGALNGHLDLLTGLFLLVAAWSLSRHRVVRAATAVCIAVGLKVVGLVMVPLFARRPVVLSVVAVVSAVVLSPLLILRPLADAASGPAQFATRWRGNESLYAFLEWGCRQIVEESAAITMARLGVVVLVFGLGAILVAKRISALRATRIILWTTLLLSPQVHPWYLAWLLPIEIASGGLAGLVWSASILCAYAPLDRWLVEGVWEMPISLHVLEYLAVVLALGIEWRRSRVENQRSNGKIEV